LFLVTLFAIFIIPKNIIQPVHGRSTGSAAFCPNWYDPTQDPPGELQLAQVATEYIAYFMNQVYDYSILAINDSAIVPSYRAAIQYLNCEDEVAFFSKGHRDLWPDAIYDHMALFDHYGNEVRDSEDIYPYSSGKFRFVFLWHCETAEMYPSTDDEGMPYCFTHNNNMVLYGQDNGYNVFLGWQDGSPAFVTIIDQQYPWGYWQYAHWVYLFFAAMSWGWTVEGALNYACNIIYSQDFTCTPLYYWLKVWGCEDICWPLY
jgi:hypothetical protein